MENQTSDSRLLELVRDSDMEAFQVLFDRYQPVIYRQVLFQTREADLAHDIVQETFIRIWEHRSSLKPHLSFLAYAFRISGNIALDAFKHRKVREKLEPMVPQPARSEHDDPAEALDLSLLEEQLMTIITTALPEKCRAVFLLSRIEGKSNRDIADLLGISVRTVENQVNHALKVIRKSLTRT